MTRLPSCVRRCQPSVLLPGLLQAQPVSSYAWNQELTKLCQQRHFIMEDDSGYGPLGTELKNNLAELWWRSVVSLREQVFGISTLHQQRPTAAATSTPIGLIDKNALHTSLHDSQLNKKEMAKSIESLLHNQIGLRTSLLQGALEHYVPSLALLNRKLPFGLAEMGTCYRPIHAEEPNGKVKTGESFMASLVWFSSPQTSAQWLEYWLRHRMLWWRKFAVSPSDFSSSELQNADGNREVRIQYNFSGGTETLETLCSLGDEVLVSRCVGSKAKLQCREGRKSVIPHVLSISSCLDTGVRTYLHNSFQEMGSVHTKRRLLQRKVLKLHPSLTPVKVALDMGRGPSNELRQVCEGLLQELLEQAISVWPGYLETASISMEQQLIRYDEMGVLFTILVNDVTLENGIAQLRNRDTSIREMMHISEISSFLTKYITAARRM
ncbi:DNA polymerase subunit gamma-2, mitochondrial [Erpetoichthys calabaricus]|uniref:DNA polymerase subunit gamma-2, mitochondrial n=1 Tax=Erpetoichthys calabaricus TaxID=27687 RepID=UPI0022345601|nr:DNA polymerase subunit gamma-2, mitochondrial [Erpetoichthys calabaricus]